MGQGTLFRVAYPATIVDLAARGYFVIEEDTSAPRVQYWCAMPEVVAPVDGLTEFERVVFDEISGQLSGADRVPFDALTDVDDAVWDRFRRTVIVSAQRLGVCGHRLSILVMVGLELCALPAAGLVFWVMSRVERIIDGLVFAGLTLGFFGAAIWNWGTANRPTALGRAIVDAAMAQSDLGAADLCDPGVLAAAVALGFPHPIVDNVVDVGAPPKSVWSGQGGRWRRVEIAEPGTPIGQMPLLLLGCGALFAVLAGVAAFKGGWHLLLTLGWGVVAVSELVWGTRAAKNVSAMPTSLEFIGVVLARWEDRDPEQPSFYASFDDGARSWSFKIDPRHHAALRIGTQVRVQTNPRNRKLLDLECL
ncbi:hypothetical protein ACQP1O_18300 [Nocardia sp. CA-151230]|uniref:hypothetical protein n=1 Tax=Nocardia sp. CA-151230 TaxID=3239982 RepID=UPI003D8C28CB